MIQRLQRKTLMLRYSLSGIVPKRQGMRKIKALLLVALSVAVATEAQAQCHPALALPSPEPSSAYSYLLAFVEGLASAKEAGDQMADKMSDTEMLVAFRRAQAQYQCAASLVEPFTKSDSEAINTSALAASVAFSGLAETQDNFRKHIVASIDAVNAGTFKPGSAADRTSELIASTEESGQLLVTAAVAAMYAAVEADPSTGLMSRLAMNASQRDQLKERLLATFGPAVAKGLAAGQTRLLGAAVAVYQVLADPKREPRKK